VYPLNCLTMGFTPTVLEPMEWTPKLRQFLVRSQICPTINGRMAMI
jgi:hypothetical protein